MVALPVRGVQKILHGRPERGVGSAGKRLGAGTLVTFKEWMPCIDPFDAPSSSSVS